MRLDQLVNSMKKVKLTKDFMDLKKGELVHKSIQDIKTVPFIPMISEIEMTTKSWADKEEYTYE